MQRFPWLVTVLCSALALTVGLLLARGAAPRPSTLPLSDPSWARMVEGQQRILAVLERIEARLASQAWQGPEGLESPAPVLAPANVPWPDLIQSLQDLTSTLELQAARPFDSSDGTGRGLVPSLRAVHERSGETDWTRLQGLEKAWRSDPAATSRDQHFLSVRDLLTEYGRPAEIYRPKRGGLHMVYRRHEEGEVGPAWYFHVQDGFVVEFFLEDELATE